MEGSMSKRPKVYRYKTARGFHAAMARFAARGVRVQWWGKDHNWAIEPFPHRAQRASI
jgi:hypothetical protein